KNRLTRYLHPPFHLNEIGQEYSIAIKTAAGSHQTRVFLYRGKYNGLNRAICHFDIEVDRETLVTNMIEKNQMIKIEFGDAQDYFETRREQSLQIVDRPSSSPQPAQAG
ncbi:MAG: hypothetical protein AAF203_10715, partial [Pseudomonadota bacterium]